MIVFLEQGNNNNSYKETKTNSEEETISMKSNVEENKQ